MRKSRWVVVVFAGVFLALVLVFLLGRDTFFPGEKRVLKEQPGLVAEESKDRGEGIKKRIELVPPKEEAPRPATVEEPDHDILQERVEEFFAYLDGEEYVRAYGFKGGTYRHFLGVASKLSSHLPVVSGEMDELLILRNNMTHFFRIMGKTDVLLSLDILSHERKRMEGALELLYEWGMREAQRGGGVIGADMEDLYEYAVFFLNTLGGKAYLLRRTSQVRILLTYYSILIIDRADKEKLNRHGVDIRPHVKLLIDDIQGYDNLDKKARYLKRLHSIR